MVVKGCSNKVTSLLSSMQSSSTPPPSQCQGSDEGASFFGHGIFKCGVSLHLVLHDSILALVSAHSDDVKDEGVKRLDKIIVFVVQEG